MDRLVTVFRFFSRLDVKNLNVVKGIQLDGLRRIGEPITLAKSYSENGADELVLVDVVASLYNETLGEGFEINTSGTSNLLIKVLLL